MHAQNQVSNRNGDQLAEALREADVTTLLMVLVLYTGDEALLDEYRPYIFGPWDYMENIPEEMKAKVRDRMQSVLEEVAAGTRGEPPMPSKQMLQKMMSVCVGQTVSDEYVPMMFEQMQFVDGRDNPKPVRLSDNANVASDFSVAVIGAGMSGICAAIKLEEAGIKHTLFEKNDAVGGTWYENSYPGAGVDTPNHVYSFSFEPNHDWPQYFSKRDELYSYFSRIAEKYGVYDRVKFQTEVVSAHYDEKRAIWKLTLNAGGKVESVEANAVIFAVGLLNRPSTPDIKGLSTFEGPTLHTARWDAGLTLAGKRVAVIGTGASGMQVAPSIAPDVDRMTIFQRSPHWVTSNPNYHRDVTPGKKWALKNIPYYANWYRFQLFWASADSIHPTLHVDPAWKTPHRSLNEANERMRVNLTQMIEKQVGDNPELLKKVIPDYPPYGKRMLRDNNWYETLKRSNVDLVTDPIREITPHSIVTEGGEEHVVDAIVLATGFSVGYVLGPVEVRGRNGVSLRDIWGEDDPRAYLGITVPGFPNMFIMYGPNTNLAHGGSAMFHTECQVGYTIQGLRKLRDDGLSSMECRQDVHDAYNVRVDEAHSGMVWAHRGVNSWYKNKAGRVFATTPWRMVDYWRWTKKLEESDFLWK
jgi:4-hydroxyacetophenone monooxygenase